MATGTARIIGFVAALLAGTAAAQAGPFMATKGRTSQPIGHYEFCKQYPAECSVRGARPAPVKMTPALWSAVSKLNTRINAAYKPMTDYEMWGREEVWSFPVFGADCEDYALEKRRELIAMGFPVGTVLMTVLRQQNGDGHAVLTLRTSGGDYILDNLDNRIRVWSNTPYLFLKRQSETNSGAWVGIDDGRADTVASVK